MGLLEGKQRSTSVESEDNPFEKLLNIGDAMNEFFNLCPDWAVVKAHEMFTKTILRTRDDCNMPFLDMIPFYIPKTYGGLGINLPHRVVRILESSNRVASATRIDKLYCRAQHDHVQFTFPSYKKEEWHMWSLLNKAVPKRFQFRTTDPYEEGDSLVLQNSLLFQLLYTSKIDKLFSGLLKDDELVFKQRNYFKRVCSLWKRLRMKCNLRNQPLNPWSEPITQCFRVRLGEFVEGWKQ